MEKEQLYASMCEILADDKYRLNEFIKLYKKYSCFSNFEKMLENEYKSEYAQCKDMVVNSSQSETDVPHHTETSHKEGSDRELLILMNEIAKNTKTTSRWVKFLGIIVLIGIIYSVISAIVLSSY